MNIEELPFDLRQVLAITQSAGDENGWMSEEEYEQAQAELRKLGVVIAMEGGKGEDAPAKDKNGRTFFEVSIHPWVQQIADEHGEVVEGDRENPSASEFNDEFGDDPDDYSDTMFRKTWSVSSWVRDNDGNEDFVDDEDFPDYDTAIVRAEELAGQYHVGIDHRY